MISPEGLDLSLKLFIIFGGLFAIYIAILLRKQKR